MVANPENFFLLSKTLGKIRRKQNLRTLLDSIVSESMNLLGADGGIILIVDEQKRIVHYAVKNILFRANSVKYEDHPMERLSSECTILHGKHGHIIIDDLDKLPEKDNIYKKVFATEAKSVVATAIRNEHNGIMGVISLTSREPERFTKENLGLLYNISQYTSTTITKLMLLDQVNKIAEIAKLLFEDINYNKLVHTLKDLFNAYGCSLFLGKYTDESVVSAKKYELVATTRSMGSDKAYEDIFYDDSVYNITSYVIKNQVCVRIHDTKNVAELRKKCPGLKRYRPKFREESRINYNSPESYLGCCLVLEGQSVGCVRITKHEIGSFFTQKDQETLNILAGFISARLRLEKQLAQLAVAKEFEYLANQVTGFGHDAKHAFTMLNSLLGTLFDFIPNNVRQSQENVDTLNTVKFLRKQIRLLINKVSSLPSFDELDIDQRGLRQIVEDVYYLVSLKLDKGKIRFINEVHPDLKLYCDAELIEQAIINLVLNAIQALREAGGVKRIIVRASNINVGSLVRTQIDVVDNGVGINDEKLPKIFNRGYSTTGGTGLGLWIVSTIIGNHGGEIYVIKRETGGSIFRIIVPNNDIAK